MELLTKRKPQPTPDRHRYFLFISVLLLGSRGKVQRQPFNHCVPLRKISGKDAIFFALVLLWGVYVYPCVRDCVVGHWTAHRGECWSISIVSN